MCPNCIRGLTKGTNEVCDQCGGTGFIGAIKEQVQLESVLKKVVRKVRGK